MTSRVAVTAHPGSGVTHVLVRVFDEEGSVFEEHKVEANETQEFSVYDGHNLEITEQ